MPNVGPLEIIVVLALVLIIFGPKRLPELGPSLGKGIREFRGSISGENDDEPPKPTLDAGTDAKPAEAKPVEATPVETKSTEHSSGS